MLDRLPIASLLTLSFILGGCASGAVTTQPSNPQETNHLARSKASKFSKTERAALALSKGEYAEARHLLQSAVDRGEEDSTVLFAELLLLMGEYETVARKSEPSAQMALLRAKALRNLGRLDEALAELKNMNSKALDKMRGKLIRGEILLEMGKKGVAKEMFLEVVAFAESPEMDGLSDSERMTAYATAGRSAHHLRQPETANDYYNHAELIGEATLDLLLLRAELYLEKHDTSHALQMYEEAAQKWKHHPDVLLLEARIGLETALAFASAQRLAKKVLAINPRNYDALFILAGVEMRVMNFDAVKRYVDRGLKTNPRELQLLSMKAAKRFLSEDPEGFDEIVRQVLQLSPKYSTLFRIVSEYAEWEHRYQDIEKLMRRAARLDREDGRIRAQLGFTLIRAGSDAAGIVELNRAYELDPFDVRVINTLNLYEKNIPELYENYRKGPFQYRFPKAESKLLKRYVPALLEQAHEEMVSRYQFTPRSAIGIEIYSSQEEFSVRTSGLPQVAIAGVCFGRKLATVSPIGAPGNLGMTLWHELAHVFHLQLSQNRVPRYLTEGMAEWETARRNVGWSRERDLRLAKALRENTLPPLNEMTRAFTHARHMEDVATAYYASGLLAEWIVESRGETRAVAILQELGKRRLPPEVVTEVLGEKSDVLDREFRDYLEKKVSRFKTQFVARQVRSPSEEMEERAKRRPDDREVQLLLGLALLTEGEVEKAKKILTKILARNFSAQAQFALARIAISKGNRERARTLLLRLLPDHDGYEIRMPLARIALAEEEDAKAMRHLETASRFDPMAEEPISMLAALRKKSGDKSGELAAVKKWAQLSEHDPHVHRLLIQLLIDHKKFPEARDAAELALWTDLAGSETHRIAGVAFARAGDLKRAEFEWESALLVPNTPRSEKKLATTWVGELKHRGLHKKAARRKSLLRERRARHKAPTQSSGSK